MVAVLVFDVSVPVFDVNGPENDLNLVNKVPLPNFPRVLLHVNILAGLRSLAISMVLPNHVTGRAKGLHYNVPPIRVVGLASAHVYIKVELSQILPIDIVVFPEVYQVCLGVDGVPLV